MPKFSYSGRTLGGDPCHGTFRAAIPQDVELKLLKAGVFVDQVRPAMSRSQQVLTKLFRRTEMTRLLRQFELLLVSGITVPEALALVREYTTDRTLRLIFEDVIAQVHAGRALSEALAAYPDLFDGLTVSMVAAGESSGHLAPALETVAGYRERYDTLVKKVRSALAYPALVVLAAVLVILALVLYIVPVFASMYGNFGAELPRLTQGVVLVSEVLRKTLWYWLAVLVLAVPAVAWLGFSAGVRLVLDRLIVTAPLLRAVAIKVLTARYCRTMGALLTAGVEIVEAQTIAAGTTGNRYLADRLRPVADALMQGTNFTDAIAAVSIFPKAMLRLAASGEATGQLGQMLRRAADYYEAQSEHDFATLTSLIEPVIILVLGGFVAFILVAMYLPLFDLIGAL